MRQGDAIETATIGYEGAVGAFAGFGMRRAHTRAVVQVRGSASRIAASRFRKVAEESEAVCRIVVRYGEMLLIQVQQTAACNALHPVEARLSRWLLQARDRLESNTIKLTHEFLSQMLGVRRTTVTVVANMLQQAGLIRYHRGHIEIVDRRGLEARACECYEAIRRPSKKSRRRPGGRWRQRRPLDVIAGHSALKTRVNALMTRQSIFFEKTSCKDDGPPETGLPDFGRFKCASRINPTCVVKPAGDGVFDSRICITTLPQGRSGEVAA